MNDLIGQSIGRYHMLEKLGEGGMASVFKAFDTRLEREVAVKVIRREAFSQEVLDRVLKRFEREAKTLARLTHPNIVSIIDYGDYEGSPYLVMPFLPGGTLKQYLGKPMPWQNAIRLVQPIASALAYAHGVDVIHRDVKPANILITASGEPMLTDFGIAKMLDLEGGQTLTGTGVGIGTPEYMAPEQGLGQALDGRADVYALGIVLYELVTGQKPFTADTPMAVVFKHMTDPLPRPSALAPDLPEGVERVLLKALAKKPEDRYQNMGEFTTAVMRLEREEKSEPATNASRPKEMEGMEDPYATADELETGDAVVQQIPPKPVPPAPVQLSKGSEQTDKPTSGNKVVGFVIGGVGILILLIIGGVSGWFSPKPTPAPIAAAVVQPANTAKPTPAPTVAPVVQPTNITQVSPKDGMVMVYVPAGEFSMGSDDGYDDERPVHTVFLDAYWFDQTEVTNAMYKKCVDSGSCAMPSDTYHFNNSLYADHPVVYVNWNMAKSYCLWAGRQLPSEAQWEKAARGNDGRTYPWGNETPTCSLANYSGCEGDSTKVGSYETSKSPFGALDMAGNVWDWVADWWGDNYYNSQNQWSNPSGPEVGVYRSLRGGSWDDNTDSLRSALRNGITPSSTFYLVGFRCSLREGVSR